VLLGGLARADDSNSRALERFLRAAEPPSHNDWKAGTDRLNAEYKQGAGVRLNQLWTDLRRTVLSLFKEVEGNTVEGPRRLAQLFPLAGRGSRTGPERFRIEDVTAELQDKAWKLRGRVRCVADEPLPWKFSLIARLDGETGQGDPLRLRQMTVDHGSAVQVNERWQCSVPAKEREVEFTAMTSTIAAANLRRTRIRVDVTGQLSEEE
jgi:RNA polymerase primary sigma factor